MAPRIANRAVSGTATGCAASICKGSAGSSTGSGQRTGSTTPRARSPSSWRPTSGPSARQARRLRLTTHPRLRLPARHRLLLLTRHWLLLLTRYRSDLYPSRRLRPSPGGPTRDSPHRPLKPEDPLGIALEETSFLFGGDGQVLVRRDLVRDVLVRVIHGVQHAVGAEYVAA